MKLLISRPEGVAGQTLTIDKSFPQAHPGRRASDYTLNLSIRSSQGGQHVITLPATAQLQNVTINGAVQQIRQDGAKITLPIQPGRQEISLEWREHEQPLQLSAGGGLARRPPFPEEPQTGQG